MSKTDIENLIRDLKLKKGAATYFQCEQLTPRVLRIVSLIEEEMVYLINGTERSVLIDTANGVCSLKIFVEQLTDNPMDVLLSHGHSDHIMGSGEFDSVYLNERDCYLFSKEIQPEKCMHVIEWFHPEELESVSPEDLCDCSETILKPLDDGMVFDLGGITLRVLDATGHTPGSMAILIEEERLLFLGASCSNITCMFDKDSSNLEDYAASMKLLKERTDGLYDKVLFSHCLGEGPVSTIEDVIDATESVLNGTSDDIEFLFLGERTFWAKEAIFTDPGPDQVRGDIVRADGRYGNILFSKN